MLVKEATGIRQLKTSVSSANIIRIINDNIDIILYAGDMTTGHSVLAAS